MIAINKDWASDREDRPFRGNKGDVELTLNSSGDWLEMSKKTSSGHESEANSSVDTARIPADADFTYIEGGINE